MNNGVIVQQVYSQSPYANMLRLSFSRHMEYAMKHAFDYQCIMSDILAPKLPGSWAKLHVIRGALLGGYEYVCWIDADALIFDMATDLREAFKEFEHVGACQHPGPPVHLNVGVAYYRNTEVTRSFVDKWLTYYGGPELDGWQEQGVFNRLGAEMKCAKRIDDRWNATHYAGTDVSNPVVLGYHGPSQFTPLARFQSMVADLARVT